MLQVKKNQEKASELKLNIAVVQCPSLRTLGLQDYVMLISGVLVPHFHGALLHMSMTSFWKAPGAPSHSQTGRCETASETNQTLKTGSSWTRAELCFDLLQRCTSRWMQHSEKRPLISHDRNRLPNGKSLVGYVFWRSTKQKIVSASSLLPCCVFRVNILKFCNILCSEELVETGRTHHWSCLILGKLGSVDTDVICAPGVCTGAQKISVSFTNSGHHNHF